MTYSINDQKRKIYSLSNYAYHLEFSNYELAEQQENIFKSLTDYEKKKALFILDADYSGCLNNAGIDAYIAAKNLYNKF